MIRLAFLALACMAALVAQPADPFQDEDYKVFSDPPRLLLTKQRLRLLQREKERTSMRWEQFDALMGGGAPMPEPGFSSALYYRVTGTQGFGRQAVEWAGGAKADPVKDLRQLALVFDWCGPVITKAQSDALVLKIQRGISGANHDTAGQSARALAAIAIADHLPDQGESVLKGIVKDWWRGEVMQKLRAGHPAVPRDQVLPFFEMMHAIRDNLRIDLRESAAAYFPQFTLNHLAGHYPAPFPGPENEFRIPVYSKDGDPDLTVAAYSRAAGMAMVAYDNNALENQFLQGWLLQDRFMMRGALGVPYEFMWANPYQPGLSYFHVPLVYHDSFTGEVFARTSWDEDATWVGYSEGRVQVFRDGTLQTLKTGGVMKPVRIGDATLTSAPAADSKGEIRVQADTEATFFFGLEPRTRYDIEIDDEELTEKDTDASGTLVLALPPEVAAGVRMKKSGAGASSN